MTMDFAGKETVIVGLAREGQSLARFLSDHGARVTVTDSATKSRLEERIQSLDGRGIRFVLGDEKPELVESADAIFVSPGIPETHPIMLAAAERNVPIQSMTTVFFDLCPGTIIGVTGSSGKTTTTGLTGNILSRSHRDVVVGGNIGDPMLDLLPAIRPQTLVVLELSSFQLGLLRRSPHVAVVTNISPNHLDRHANMDSYVAAKRNIVAWQTSADYAVLNQSDPEAAAFRKDTPAHISWFAPCSDTAQASTRDGQIGLIHEDRFISVMPQADVPLLGRHNLENVLAAIATCDILGVSAQQMRDGVVSYRAAPHRLQTIGEHMGVLYIDDSIATSPARASVALESMKSPVLLIAGGRHKNLPWTDWAQLIVRKAWALFLIGEASEDIEQAVRTELRQSKGLLEPERIFLCQSLPAAVEEASAMARPGDVVLLSPGCTSYDMFGDYEERGEVFARAVEALDAA